MKATKEMFKLGQVVFLEGIKKLKEYKEMSFIHQRHEMIIKKRLAVVEFTHGLELILKAILIKRGYSIYKLKNSLFKENAPLKSLLDMDRTVDLSEVIRFFKKDYTDLPFGGVDKLRELRNQIIHRGSQIDEKKREYFIDAINCLIGLYDKENIKHRKFIQEIEQAKSQI